MADKILLVDDEPAVLEGYKRLLYRDFTIATAPSGEVGLALLREAGPFSVVVSDMRMPGMNGAEFLAAASQKAPTTTRMLLTGHADLDAAIDAVNRGKIFRFLSKPCPREVLVEAIREGVAQYQAAQAVKDLIEKSKQLEKTKSELEAVDAQNVENFHGLAGLPDAEQAKNYIRSLLGTSSQAFVILLKFTFFRMVAERYGEEAAAEYLMSAVQYLREGFSGHVRMFQWNRDVLMAVVQRQISPSAIRMEIARIISKNESHVFQHEGRRTMVAFSLTFDLLPVAQFRSLDEMLAAFDTKLSGRL